MFQRRKKDQLCQPVPERAGYTKYYEHDGQLRAYANRSMLMAGLFGVIALVRSALRSMSGCSRRRSFASPQMAKRRWLAEGRPARLRR